HPLDTQSEVWVQTSPTTPPPPSSMGPHATSASPAPTRAPQRIRFMPTTPSCRRARTAAAEESSSVHRAEEVRVRLGRSHVLENDLHRVDGREGVEDLPQRGDPDQVLRPQKQLLLPRAGLVDVQAGEDALLHQLAVEDDLRVSGALELLEDDLVHPASG